MNTQNTETLEIGCYFDGSRGIYIGEEVQELAKEYGWQGEYLDSEAELYMEAWTEAEDYLADFCPQYTYCGGNEGGDWGVWPIVDDDGLPKFNDLAEIPKDFNGDCYIVNDHGNVSCLAIEHGDLACEYWDCV